jgi:hypothetical protein
MRYCFTLVTLSARMTVVLDVASCRLRYKIGVLLPTLNISGFIPRQCNSTMIWKGFERKPLFSVYSCVYKI